ncbi:MAG: DUF3299 domain-containing protein [Pseudomonadota bacterium]
MLSRLTLLGAPLLLLAACGETATAEADDANLEQVIAVANAEPEAPASDTSFEARGVTLLAWEDLMPDGEDARLAELYAEFYEELQARMSATQAPLSSQLSEAEEFDLLAIDEGSDMDTMTQIGTFNVVEDLDGMKVRLPGYIVPLDFSADAEHREFLLVPYFGACLHSPPPPPNQIVYVTSEPAAKIPNIYEPVWLEGEMKTGRFDTDMANSAYELKLALLEPYEY